MPRIFINYRRADASAYAKRIYDGLSRKFGNKAIFMDVDNITLGADFATELQRSMIQCDALVVIIGDRWLSSENRYGVRRLHDSVDFVRLEIATALKQDIKVLPVLVAGASMPRSEDLPEPISPLARLNALVFTDLTFEQNVQQLALAIEKAGSKKKWRKLLRALFLYIPRGHMGWVVPSWVGRLIFWYSLLLLLNLLFMAITDPKEFSFGGGDTNITAIFLTYVVVLAVSWLLSRFSDSRAFKGLHQKAKRI